MLILLPYYIIKYERELSKIAQDELRTEKLVKEYQNIVYQLEKEAKSENTGMFRDLARMMRRILEYLLRNEPDLKERVSETMGGKVLRLPSDELREAKEAGMAEGRAEAMAEGRAKTKEVIMNMIKRNISIEDICAIIECDVDFVEEVRKQMK